ncbi:hypothetical protein DdX_04880 [Ditylenchus destructor]|uniref:Uncharacterized protein n=1 Tax=Ditylenchus destructor TaxID=166010 RepID=A0AAD4NA01_9BILA|nr:hypothetical protein DdX_04880 [Ditylenchus destructor]
MNQGLHEFDSKKCIDVAQIKYEIEQLKSADQNVREKKDRVLKGMSHLGKQLEELEMFISQNGYSELLMTELKCKKNTAIIASHHDKVEILTREPQVQHREISFVSVDTPPPPPLATDYNRNRLGINSGRGKMASSRLYANASIAIRLLVLILVIVAMILIMTAPGVCFWRTINGQQTSREICPPSNSLFPMNIDRWNSALHFQMRGQNVWGQLALIILSILFALPPLIFSCIYYTSGRHLSFSQLIAAGVGIIAFLIFGAFEVWYTTGFDHMPTFIRQIGGGTFSGCAGIPGCETGFVVKGWAVAAAFYFLCAVLYVFDAIVIFLMRDK